MFSDDCVLLTVEMIKDVEEGEELLVQYKRSKEAWTAAHEREVVDDHAPLLHPPYKLSGRKRKRKRNPEPQPQPQP